MMHKKQKISSIKEAQFTCITKSEEKRAEQGTGISFVDEAPASGQKSRIKQIAQTILHALGHSKKYLEHTQ